MVRILGVVTGALLVGGSVFFYLKSSQEAHQMPMPSISALSSQWSACSDDQQTEQCQTFQTQTALVTAPAQTEVPTEASIEQPEQTFEAVANKVASKIDKAMALNSGNTRAVKPDPSVTTEVTEAVLEAVVEETVEEKVEAKIKDTVEEKVQATVTAAEEFALDTVSGSYEADQLFSNVTEDDTYQDAQWQVFWSPFQSEIAAKGFAAQIAKISGVAVQVIKQGHLKYMVAYPYTTPEERTSRAEAIEKAFGMRIRNQGDWS